jgi:hypothetical protein
MEVILSEDPVPKTAEFEHENLKREEILALLRDVTEQRDKLLSQYEAMALQVDDSAREINDASTNAQHSAKKAEESEQRAVQEAARASQLLRQLDEERQKRASIATELARYRDAMEHAPVEDPWGVLWRAISQIVRDSVAWVRAKIPPNSPLLPWFDRAVELAKTLGRLALKCGKALFEWAKPRTIQIWKWLKGEIARLSRTE